MLEKKRISWGLVGAYAICLGWFVAGCGPENAVPRAVGATTQASVGVRPTQWGNLRGTLDRRQLPVELPVPTVRVISESIDPAVVAARRANRPALPSSHTSIVARLGAFEAGAEVELTLKLPTVPGAQLPADLDDANREQAVATLEALLAPVHARMTSLIEQRGGRVLRSRWLGNQLDIRISARAALELIALPEVESASLNSTDGGVGFGYEGTLARATQLTDTLHASGFGGQSGGRAGGRVRLGIIEWGSGSNVPERNHPAFMRGGASRFVAVYNCTSGTCVTDASSASATTHGSRVAWVAAGSIEAGQDPNFPGSGNFNQQSRSGIAPEADLYYYQVNSCNALSSALQRAVQDGVDVANFSGWVASQGCASSFDCGGVNASIKAANDAGMMFAACAGNGGGGTCLGSGCNLWFPGWRPDSFSVNGLAVEGVAPNYTPRDYTSSPIGNTSTGACIASQGGMAAQTLAGTPFSASGVAMTAPGQWNNSAEFSLTYHSSSSTGVLGCSFATPSVAGNAGLLRQMFNSIGWSGSDARGLFVNMLLQGDNWADPGSGDLPAGISSQGGYGRLRMHYPSNDSLVAPWGWGWQSFVIQQGQTVEWTVWDSGPESQSVTHWKWAFAWFDDNLNSSSDIVIEVRDVCAPGGPVMVRSDYSYDYRKGIRLWAPSIGGKCLVMRATAFLTPAGGTRVYTADYFHGGDSSTH